MVSESQTAIAAIGYSTHKKTASQEALVRVLCKFLGLEAEDAPPLLATPIEQHVARDPALTCPPNVNAKGLLFEWCQKHKVSAPIFSHTTEGPSHKIGRASCRERVCQYV